MARRKMRLNVPFENMPERRTPVVGDIAVISGKGYPVEAFDGRYVFTRIGQFRLTHPSLEGFVSATVTTADAKIDEKEDEGHEPVQDE